jgi:elongation factor 1-gamma
MFCYRKLTSVLQGNPRSPAILAVAKANNVELEVVETQPAKGLSAEYLKLNKLGKVPTFVGADGYTLHEAIAIAIYSTWKKLSQSYLRLPPIFDPML